MSADQRCASLRVPSPGAGEVHVWQASLAVPPRVAHALASALHDDERARADRLKHEEDRRRFTIARGLLRAIVASYRGLTPGAVRFAYGPHGKPMLAPTVGLDDRQPDLTFSVSHCRDVALYAIAHRQRVGIDVEYVDPDVDVERLARRVLSADEAATLRLLDVDGRRPAFYRAWTSKEASLKARGVGLLAGEAGEDRSRWSLIPLPVAADYVATLAVEGTHDLVRLRSWRSGVDQR